MLKRHRTTVARVGLTAAGYIALLSRVPADHPVWVTSADLEPISLGNTPSDPHL
jgi:hypothetical protein